MGGKNSNNFQTESKKNHKPNRRRKKEPKRKKIPIQNRTLRESNPYINVKYAVYKIVSPRSLMHRQIKYFCGAKNLKPCREVLPGMLLNKKNFELKIFPRESPDRPVRKKALRHFFRKQVLPIHFAILFI